MSDNFPRHVMGLAGLGLTPYVGALLAIALGPVSIQGIVVNLLADYSFGIIAFLLGAWWGLTLIRRLPLVLYFSNALFLLALFCHSLLPAAAWFMVAATLMMVIWWAEGVHPLFRPQPRYYRHLRGLLSGVSAFCLVLAAALVGY